MIRIITLLIGLLLFVYIIIAAIYFKEVRRSDVCQAVEVVVKDSLEKHFVTNADLTSFLKRENLYPVNQPVVEINTDKIEKALLTNEMIARVEAYKTPSGIIKLEVEQKMPVLRIISPGGNYYVDNRGTMMPVSNRYVAHVPVASGYVEKELAITELYKFALFLHKNKFWNAQIEQIYIHSDGDVELIPRVGNHRVVLGALDGFEEKLDNLQLFYDRIVPKMGWEKYSIVNLKYKNQIVCTKR